MSHDITHGGTITADQHVRAHEHSHSHDHGGHGHGHSHDGYPDHHEDGDGNGNEEDDMKEARHYTDVCHHMAQYAQHSIQRFDLMVRDFSTLTPFQQSLVPQFHTKQQAIRRAIVQNYQFIRGILSIKQVFWSSPAINYHLMESQPRQLNEERMSKVRTTVRQCVRDWAKEGATERAQCYGPLLAELSRLFPDVESRGERRILVPGSGLGRLTWEVANLGFFSQGNEFSYFMLIASYYILNCISATEAVEIFPYIHETKNILNASDQFRTVRIPDVDPNSLPKTSHFSMVAGDFLEVFGPPSVHRDAKTASNPNPAAPSISPLRTSPSNLEQQGAWDGVCSCFFIDCANNIIEFVETIAWLLKPGGYWINFGPLLYHYSEMPGEISIDLTYDELKPIFAAYGLRLLAEKTNIPCQYITDTASMLQQTYHCVMFTCIKMTDEERAAAKMDAAATSTSSSTTSTSTSTSTSTTPASPPASS